MFRNGPKFGFGTTRRDHDTGRSRYDEPGPGAYCNDFSEFSERSQRIVNIIKRL